MSFEDHLPETLREIAEVIGLEAMIDLVRARGGTVIYVPAQCGKDHWLVQVLGRDKADALCKHYRTMPDKKLRGEEITLPIWGKSALARAKAQAYNELEKAEAEGLSATEAVQRSGLSLRSVKRYRAQKRLDAPSKLPLLELMVGDDKTK